MNWYSFRQIDWVTNTMWLLLYSISLMGFLYFFWWDYYIKDFKTSNIEYRREEILVSEVHKQYTALLAQKNSYENSNSVALSKINNPLTAGGLQAILKNSSGGNVNVKAFNKKEKLSDGIEQSKFQISGIVKTTRELKEILQALQTSPYTLELDFPIRFEQTKKGLKYMIGVKSFSKSGGGGIPSMSIPNSALPNSVQKQ